MPCRRTLRHDDSSQFGGRTTGAFAWGYRFLPGWRVTASAGTAFKAPTFNDLYFPGFSNPDLRPETSRNIEAGLYTSGRQGAADWQARVVAYRNRVRDLIVFQCDANFDCRPNNVADATLKGVTLAGDAQWRDTSLHASLDLQSPTDADTGHLLPRRARRHGVVSLSQPLGRARVVAEVVGSSARFDDAENQRAAGRLRHRQPRAGMDGRCAHDAVRSRRQRTRSRLQLAADFSTGGARVFGGVRWQM